MQHEDSRWQDVRHHVDDGEPVLLHHEQGHDEEDVGQLVDDDGYRLEHEPVTLGVAQSRVLIPVVGAQVRAELDV